MTSHKRHWAKPQLIILARGKPEENVLEHCKRIGDYISSEHLYAQAGCDKGDNQNCGACQARSES